jgi:hypothetical protein
VHVAFDETPGVCSETPGGGPAVVRVYYILVYDVVAEVRTEVRRRERYEEGRRSEMKSA